MSDRCAHETDGNVCLHEAHRRTGPGAKIFGEHPACDLLRPGAICPDRAEGVGDNSPWARLAKG